MKQMVFSLLSLVLAWNGYSQTPSEVYPNLIANGDFELGDLGFRSDYARSRYAGAGLYAITDDAAKFSAYYFQGKGEGKFMAIDGSNYPNRTVWEETINVNPQTEYSFSCWLCTLNTRTGLPAQLLFYINNTTLGGLVRCPQKTNKWEQFRSKFFTNKETQIKIRIVLASPRTDGNDFGLDRIKLIESSKNVEAVVVKKTRIKVKSDGNKKSLSDSVKLKPKISTDTLSEKPVILKNVFFAKGRFEILPSSFKELNKLAEYLSQNKNLNVAILGHTDNLGDKKENKILSENRANAVRNYLIKKGINQNRISAQGFGGEKPIDNTGTSEGRQKNRRVEFLLSR